MELSTVYPPWCSGELHWLLICWLVVWICAGSFTAQLTQLLIHHLCWTINGYFKNLTENCSKVFCCRRRDAIHHSTKANEIEIRAPRPHKALFYIAFLTFLFLPHRALSKKRFKLLWHQYLLWNAACILVLWLAAYRRGCWPYFPFTFHWQRVHQSAFSTEVGG